MRGSTTTALLASFCVIGFAGILGDRASADHCDRDEVWRTCDQDHDGVFGDGVCILSGGAPVCVFPEQPIFCDIETCPNPPGSCYETTNCFVASTGPGLGLLHCFEGAEEVGCCIYEPKDAGEACPGGTCDGAGTCTPQGNKPAKGGCASCDASSGAEGRGTLFSTIGVLFLAWLVFRRRRSV